MVGAALGLMFAPTPAPGAEEAPPDPAPEVSLEIPESAPVRLIGDRQSAALREALVGGWGAKVGKRELRLQLYPDGRYTLDGLAGTFEVAGNQLILSRDAGTIPYTFDLGAGDLLTVSVLTLSGGDLPQPLRFSAQKLKRAPGDYLRDLFQISPGAVRTKVERILVIAAVVLLSRLLIAALRGLSHYAVYSQRGPFKVLYRNNPNRSRTIHSLVLNLIKYVVYFSALGQVLTELGVNYTTYLASLSVIGLAVGFGSQGLVQDIVTGFFIIFEGQFDVGDLVEISGQTGIVTELGLRMTSLRNHNGQTVVIPNRNIAVVGNYRAGAMRACIDTAFADPNAAGRALPALRALGLELQRQFAETILSPPTVSGPLAFESGLSIARLELGIWPGQQWVVDQQAVPRLRQTLQAQGLEVAGDRVMAYYHPPRRSHPEDQTPFWRRIAGRFGPTP